MSRLRLPRRTARLRLTVLYVGLCLLSGVVLLGILYLLVNRAVNAHPAGVAPAQATITQSGSRGTIAVEFCGDAAARKQLARWMGDLLTQSGVALGIATVIAVALGWLVASRVLRPLSTIAATARRISASSLHERLALQGPDDELKDLGDTLDDLFARLQASFEAQRHFVANASHELRTPVTRERALLQVALADPAATADTWRCVGEQMLASNREQERLIEALLTLASSEGGADRSEPIDLTAVAGAALLARGPEIDGLGLRAEISAESAALDGDPLLIERLVGNLIDNAVRHNVAGGRVGIATWSGQGRAALLVTNTGPVIPPAEVGRLFQPFQRLGGRSARRGNGHGLGLSIVRAIASAHGAAIDVHANHDGGLTVTVTFPPSPAGRASSAISTGQRSG